MAKHETVAILLPVALLAWLPKNNYRKNYGDEALNMKLKTSLREHEWVQDNPIPVREIKPDELAEEMKRRQDKWEVLKTTQVPGAGDERKVFETLYVNPKTNKIIEPEYSANAGFRRAGNYFAAMVERFRDKAKPEMASYEITGRIPARVAVYKNRIEEIIGQQLENEMQGVGTKKMEDLEKLRVSKDLYDEGCKEIDIRRLYNTSSTAQKLFGICQVDHNWPELNFINRFYLDPKDSDFLAWGPVRAADLLKFNKRFRAQQKIADKLSLTPDERGLPEVNADEVDLFFRNKSKGVGEGNAPKIMAKADIESLSQNNKLRLVEKTASAVLHNSAEHLKRYMAHSDSLNGAVELIDNGKGKTLDSVVNTMVEHKDSPNLFGMVATLVAIGREAEVQEVLEKLILNPPPAPPVPSTPIVVSPETRVQPVDSVPPVDSTPPVPVETAPVETSTTIPDIVVKSEEILV